MKGVLLAAGTGTRLLPVTRAVNKHLLPVYDKPMIYYPLATLMQAGIRDILVVVNPADLAAFQELLADGRQWGMQIGYAVQGEAKGIAQAFLAAEAFLDGDSCCVILGDNIICGTGIEQELRTAAQNEQGATVFCYPVANPQEFGVITVNGRGQAVSLAEKPQRPQSNLVLIGLYYYDPRAITWARQLQPSARGELEITDLNRQYLAAGDLHVVSLEQYFWLDTGTWASLRAAAGQLQNMEAQAAQKIAVPEEIAWQNGWITEHQLYQCAAAHANSEYGQYLTRLIQRNAD